MVEGSDKSLEETAVPTDDPTDSAPAQESEGPSPEEPASQETAPAEEAGVGDSEGQYGVDPESRETDATETDEEDGAEAGEQEDEGDEVEDEPAVAPTGPIELIEDEEEEIVKDWYILKVQSNRERSITAALQRKVAIEGLERYFGDIMVPTEKVTEFKAGKKKIVERKIWPGYIAVQMHVNDDTWFAIRETSGIGDFTGSGGKPTPMAPHDVAKILQKEDELSDEAPKLDIKFKEGDKVKVKDGNFESFEGEVSKIDEIHGKVTVMISIFGRTTPVELEYWQVEAL